jgi:hypothetical protein
MKQETQNLINEIGDLRLQDGSNKQAVFFAVRFIQKFYEDYNLKRPIIEADNNRIILTYNEDDYDSRIALIFNEVWSYFSYQYNPTGKAIYMQEFDIFNKEDENTKELIELLSKFKREEE